MTERYTHLDQAHLYGEMDALMRFQPATAAPQVAEPTAVAVTAGAPRSRVSANPPRLLPGCYPSLRRALKRPSTGARVP